MAAAGNPFTSSQAALPRADLTDLSFPFPSPLLFVVSLCSVLFYSPRRLCSALLCSAASPSLSVCVVCCSLIVMNVIADRIVFVIIVILTFNSFRK